VFCTCFVKLPADIPKKIATCRSVGQLHVTVTVNMWGHLLVLDITKKSWLLYITHLIIEMMMMMMVMTMMMITSAFKENNSHDAKALLAEKHSHVPFFRHKSHMHRAICERM